MATTNNNKHTAGTAIGIGAGVAAAAAAAAGAYWLYGAKHSAQHRKMAKSWMLKARAEVLDAVEKMKDIDKATYLSIVDSVMKRYANMNITAQEMAQMMRDFKTAWVHMQVAQKSGAHGVKTAKRTAKRVKSAARKSVSKK
jgi:hypothetical protein